MQKKIGLSHIHLLPSGERSEANDRVLFEILLGTVYVIIKFPPNARTHGYGYGRPTNARTGVHRCTNRRPRQMGTGVRQILKWASDRTNTERAKWWRIPANDIYVIPGNDTCE